MKTNPLIILFGIVLACGTKDSIELDLTQGQGAAAFADPLSTDLIIELTSVPGSIGKVIDANGDGAADVYVYPLVCGLDKKAGCGYPLATKSTVGLEGLPKGYIYSLKARFRNAAGSVLYEGTGEVNSSQSAQKISVNVVKL